jgi:HNH endonuclease
LGLNVRGRKVSRDEAEDGATEKETEIIPLERPWMVRRERLEAARRIAIHSGYEWAWMIEACGDRCLVCGSTELPLTKDHVIPISQGGSDGIENLQPLCFSDNSRQIGLDYRPAWIVAKLASGWRPSKPVVVDPIDEEPDDPNDTSLIDHLRLAAKKRWEGIPEEEIKAATSRAGKAAWANMTPEQRSEEMKRRAAKRKTKPKGKRKK